MDCIGSQLKPMALSPVDIRLPLTTGSACFALDSTPQCCQFTRTRWELGLWSLSSSVALLDFS